MKYGYARVSTKVQAADGNSLENQIELLEKAGAEIIYKDAFSGTKLDRPELNKLLQVLKCNNTLIVTKLDRFARSIGQTSEMITKLIDNGIKIEVLNVGVLDNSSVCTLFNFK